MQESGDNPGDLFRKLLCEADIENGYTATNSRDCDDHDPTITGRIGAYCPQNMITVKPGAHPIEWRGFLSGQREFVFVFGQSTPSVGYVSAQGACEGWSGSVHDGDTWIPLGGLATLSTSELEQAVELVDTVRDSWEGFVGIHWAGGLEDEDMWVWRDGTAPEPPGAIGWCDGIPDLEQDPAIVRLALIVVDGEACFGMPIAEEPRDAWFMCSRPVPNPADYAMN